MIAKAGLRGIARPGVWPEFAFRGEPLHNPAPFVFDTLSQKIRPVNSPTLPTQPAATGTTFGQWMALLAALLGWMFDVLNGLVQLLRTRWESRQNTPVLSARKQLTDVDRSVIAVEKALTSMGELSSSVALTEEEWATRKQVVDRILLRPLRAYRSSLQTAAVKNEGRSRAIIEQADEPTVE